MLNSRRASIALTIAIVSLCGACAQDQISVDLAYQADYSSWRAHRLKALKAESGWLTLVGLYWLKPGDNRLGAAPENAIILPSKTFPDRAGSLFLDDSGAIILRPDPGVALTVDGRIVIDERPLLSDRDGDPDIVFRGQVSFHVIARGGRFAVRVKDTMAPTRTGFEGIDFYDLDPDYRVEARFKAYEEPRSVMVATAVGTEEEMLAPGLLHFTLDDRDLSLEPFVSSPEDPSLFIVFRDQTSGKETYGAGRFLSAEAPADGTVVLDFNRAVNPPCAFTPFATCPLAPSRNQLGVDVTAGEKYNNKGH